ncbi:unnamed protein product [[Candida] boidinii]|uniref:Unnamed protein product n=1 Tax=Candida boidinii TaxID=5477 RepID=A0A9W6T566_CANBO|nr:unnamed protein product [[Candida] boidinii]
MSPISQLTESLNNESFQIKSPNGNEPLHQKAPSMHAHFYVEDTLRHAGARSRSNSGSTVDTRSIVETIMNDDYLQQSLQQQRSQSQQGGVNSSSSSTHFPAISQPHSPQQPGNGIREHNSSGIVSNPPSINGGASSSASGGAGTGAAAGVAGTTNASASASASTAAILNGTVSAGVGAINGLNVDARLPQDDGKLHILFGACGSVSIKKTRLIINKLEEIYKDKVSIQLIITKASEHFVSRGEFPSDVQIWRDKDEWTTWSNRADPVLHIELRRWADILIIAPLTANTLSKIALGLCDNLLTNVVRAWNTQYPILLAPAMVSFAYASVITKRHVKSIKDDMKWVEFLKPTEKVVSSYGEIGMGGMMDWNEIVDKIVQKLGGYPEEEDDEDDDDEEEDDDEDDKKKKKSKKDESAIDDDDDDEDDDNDNDNDEDDDDDNDDDDDDDDDNDDEDDNGRSPSVLGIRKITVAEEDEINEATRRGIA